MCGHRLATRVPVVSEQMVPLELVSHKHLGSVGHVGVQSFHPKPPIRGPYCAPFAKSMRRARSEERAWADGL